MRYSDIKEVYKLAKATAEEIVVYGEFNKQDIEAFIEFIENDEEVKAEQWTRTSKAFPFEISELWNDYCRENGFVEEEEENDHWGNDDNEELLQEYYRNVL
jgi:hypothetical protein